MKAKLLSPKMNIGGTLPSFLKAPKSILHNIQLRQYNTIYNTTIPQYHTAPIPKPLALSSHPYRKVHVNRIARHDGIVGYMELRWAGWVMLSKPPTLLLHIV